MSWLADDVIIRMKEMSLFNENTQNAYNMLFGKLLGD